MVRHSLIAVLLLSLTGCATGAMALKDTKRYLRDVDDNYGCRGIAVHERAALCIYADRLTVSVPFN